jgi:hypothetical protein
MLLNKYLRPSKPLYPLLKKSLPVSIRNYHSYPDPNEKPRISTFKSDAVKTLTSKEKFSLNSDFHMKKAFPGSPLSEGINLTNPPQVQTSNLSNGLLIASHELPGSMMATFAFIVKCGRY